MSLVNEMLKDLENSKQNLSAMEGLESPPIAKSNMRYYLLTAIVSVALIIFVYNQDTPKNSSVLKDQSSVSNSEKSLPVILENTALSTEIQKPILTEPDSQKIETQALEKVTSKPTLEKKRAENPPRLSEVKEKTFKNNRNNKTATLAMKTASRTSTANRELSNLISQWKLNNQLENENSLQIILKQYGDLAGVWLKAVRFLKANEPSFYYPTLKLAIQQFPDKILFPKMLAQSYFYQKQYELAIKSLDDIDEKNKDEQIYQLTGLILQKQNKHQQAISNYQKLLAIKPQSGKIQMAMAISYEALNQSDQAVEHFIIALKDRQLNDLQKQFIRQRLVAYQG